MIILTVIEVIPFTVYLMLWVGLFALSYQALGMNIEADQKEGEGEYPYIS